MATGREAALNGQVSLYPNPTASQLNIELTLEAADGITISVFNLMGTLLANEDLGEIQHSKLQLDLSSLENGIYLVQITGSKGTVNRKIQILR